MHYRLNIDIYIYILLSTKQFVYLVDKISVVKQRTSTHVCYLLSGDMHAEDVDPFLIYLRIHLDGCFHRVNLYDVYCNLVQQVNTFRGLGRDSSGH